MNDLVELYERPSEISYMLAGWHQWADAGSVSSGLPQYLIRHLHARKIGAIKPDGFYLFQIPATHHLLRPVVKLKDGYRQELSGRQNEIHYAGDRFAIFIGEEPHQKEDEYAAAFLDMVEELGVKRVVIAGGVNGPVPYDKNREFSCVYSLPSMREDLGRYAVRFSNYEGGSTIGAYLAHKAEERNIEVAVFYAMVPSYQFADASAMARVMSMDDDFKAWYDLMRRVNYMFGLDIDISDLERKGKALAATWRTELQQLGELSDLEVQEYLDEVSRDFAETTFEPLSSAWEDAIEDLFGES
ncbi:MAG: PAC2 family protein [Chloroflexi bacterium]|nr:PAC2 family protein [Chloroflexota bacterium]